MDNQLGLSYRWCHCGLFALFWGFGGYHNGGKRVLAEDQARLARSRTAQAKVLQIGKSVTQEGEFHSGC